MRRLVAVLVGTMLVVAGCGGDDDDTGGAEAADTTAVEAEDEAEDEAVDDESTADTVHPDTVSDSCALLTPEQIGDVIGTEVADGTDLLGSCEYPTTDGDMNVSVELIDQERYEEREAGDGIEAVSGVGAAAFSDTSNGFLYVDAAGTWFRVNVTGGGLTADEVLELNRQLAELVIEQV